MKINNEQFNIGDHVLGFSPNEKSINGHVTQVTSLGVYVTDGVKSQCDRLKVEASEWHSIERCNIRRA